MEIDFLPPREETTNYVFADIIIADPDTVKLYTDLTAIFSFTINR